MDGNIEKKYSSDLLFYRNQNLDTFVCNPPFTYDLIEIDQVSETLKLQDSHQNREVPHEN